MLLIMCCRPENLPCTDLRVCIATCQSHWYLSIKMRKASSMKTYKIYVAVEVMRCLCPGTPCAVQFQRLRPLQPPLITLRSVQISRQMTACCLDAAPDDIALPPGASQLRSLLHRFQAAIKSGTGYCRSACSVTMMLHVMCHLSLRRPCADRVSQIIEEPGQLATNNHWLQSPLHQCNQGHVHQLP